MRERVEKEDTKDEKERYKINISHLFAHTTIPFLRLGDPRRPPEESIQWELVYFIVSQLITTHGQSIAHVAPPSHFTQLNSFFLFYFVRRTHVIS